MRAGEPVRVDPNAALNGVMQVKAFDVVQAKLADAHDLDSVMLAGWEAFELTYQVAYKASGLRTGMFATWMAALGPASDGSGALDPGPYYRQVEPTADPLDLASADENNTFEMLAAFAAQLRDRLSEAARDTHPERVHDAKACGRAADAASELHALFALDE